MANLREQATGSRTAKSGSLRSSAKKSMKNSFGKLPSEQDLPKEIHAQTLGPTEPQPAMPTMGKGFQYLKRLAKIPGLRNKERQ